MGDIFAMIVQSSIVGTFFVALILLFRWMTRNTTKLYVRILWILLLVELLVPPVFKSPFDSMRGILGRAEISRAYEWMVQEDTSVDVFGGNNSGMPGENVAAAVEDFDGEIKVTAGGNLAESEKETQGEAQGKPLLSHMNGTTFIFLIWLTGTTAMLFYYLEEFLRLRRSIKYAVRTADGAWECEGVETPFVLPGFPAKIYLPLGLAGTKREDILAHERQHIRYMDPWLKLAATLALAVHWFNPLVWLAYSLLGKDFEMFCDESVLRGKSLEDKKHYSQTLLDFAVEKKGFSLTMQFGENGTGKRVAHILHAKKPQLLVSILLIVLVCVCGIFFLTSGSGKKQEYGAIEADLSDNAYVQAIKEAGEKEYAKDAISYTWEMDFDGNGKNEAFVAVGIETQGKLGGDIWFINERKEPVLWEEYAYLGSGQEYFAADTKDYLLLTYIAGNGVETDVYGMPEGGESYQDESGADKVPENMIPYTGAKHLNENGEVICNVEAYDEYYMIPGDSFSGHTIKPYMFIYQNGAFVQMSGREVTEEEVKKQGSMDAIEVMLENSGDAKKERQYILRENGELQINLADIYEEEIWFSYVLCSLGEDGVWQNAIRGSGYYLLSLEGEENQDGGIWLRKLKAELGIADYTGISADIMEDSVKQSSIVGTVFEPDVDMSSRIAAAEDFSKDWEVKIRKSMEEDTEISPDTVVLVEETDGFKLYGTNQWCTMLVETPDGEFVLSEDNYITSNYQIQPRCRAADYDDDGETELAVITTVAHGTGVFIEYLFMVDKNEDGQWCMYQFMEEDYQAQLSPHFDTVYGPEGVRLQFDGEVIGVISEIEQERLEQNYCYYTGTQIRYDFAGEIIWQQAELVGCDEEQVILTGDYPGHEIDSEVAYRGCGKWKLENARYADSNVNERIVNAVDSYFTGNYGDVQEYHVAKGYQLEDFNFQCEPMEVEILKIHYQNQKLDEGSVEAVATIRRGNEDSLDYLAVYLVAEEKNGMDTVWKITDWYLEK